MIRDGLFGKGGRTATSPDKEPVVDDEHYVIKVINLPLVEQTRKTRISKRLEDSRDGVLDACIPVARDRLSELQGLRCRGPLPGTRERSPNQEVAEEVR